jgi:hypothetical protein
VVVSRVEIDEKKNPFTDCRPGSVGSRWIEYTTTRARRCRPDLAGAALAAAASLCLATIVPDSTLNRHGLFCTATICLAAIGLAPVSPSSAFVLATVVFGRSLALMSHQIAIGIVR